MLRFWIDLVACTIQAYIVCSITCMIFPMREPHRKSFLIIFVQLMTTYFLVNYYFWQTPFRRIICGIFIHVIFGYFAFEGNRIKKILYPILEYFLFLLMDVALQFFFFRSFTENIVKLPPLDQKLLGRNMATASLFLIYVVGEAIVKRKEEKQKIGIRVLAIVFAFVQLQILNVLGQSNPEDMIESRIFITAIFSMIMIGGFFIVTEMYQSVLRQQEKQKELEQMALEKEYQYDYYKTAVAQGERLRDLRHDMRNQLQTVEYLIQSESEEDRKRAEEMVKKLSEMAGEV